MWDTGRVSRTLSQPMSITWQLQTSMHVVLYVAVSREVGGGLRGFMSIA